MEFYILMDIPSMIVFGALLAILFSLSWCKLRETYATNPKPLSPIFMYIVSFVLSFLLLFFATGYTVSQYSTTPASTASTSKTTSQTQKTAYWVPKGKSYHYSKNCSTLSRSSVIKSGTLANAKSAGKYDPCNICAGGK